MRTRRERMMRGGGFSLVEVLLAMFILGIGLAMVASIFPVGAEWTRQSVEESVGVVVARNAVGIIETKYDASVVAAGNAINSTNVLPGSGVQALPGFATVVPVGERAYDFGRNVPYPAVAAGKALYFWTAMIRPSPAGANRYDLYVLVFKKGAVEQTFGVTTPSTFAAGTEVPGTRAESYVPFVATVAVTGVSSANQFQVTGDVRGINGSQVIEPNSGSVFRVIGVIPNGANSTVTVNGAVPTNPAATLLCVPPADGTAASPLVYVYQTTVGF